MATTFGGVQRFRIGVRLGPGTITAEPDPAQVDEGTIVEWFVTPDSIDPVLRRLERQGWIRSEWKNSGNKQRAKFYALTEGGRLQTGRRAGTLEQVLHGDRRPLKS